MLVKDLIGTELDYHVAKAIGMDHPPYLREMSVGCCMVEDMREDEDGPIRYWKAFQPSTEWAVGGPLIHEYGLRLVAISDDVWESEYYDGDNYIDVHGETPLIAAMRALVASVFGYEVESIKED